LCRRAIEPRYDTWTLPAGFMELSETTSQGALRETDEEAGADIRLGQLFTVLDVPRVNQVHMYFLPKATSERLNPGPESLEARFFNWDEVPWDPLSFRTVSQTLKAYQPDRASCVVTTHYHSIQQPVGPRFFVTIVTLPCLDDGEPFPPACHALKEPDGLRAFD